MDVESATHPVRVRAKRKDVFEVELAEGAVAADSDFVLRWRPVVGKAPGAALFYEQWGGERYALLMVLPPDPELAGTRRLSKETIFVIDTSGSMGGTSIRQARAALTHALRRMNPNDAFNVIRFDSTVERLHDGARPVSPSAIRDAVDWVSGLEARGGTEMLPALKAALAHGAERRAVRQIIFITDGEPNNPTKANAASAKLISDGVLILGVGVAVGSAANADKKIKDMISQPVDEHYVYIDDFDKMKQQLADITKMVCPIDCEGDWTEWSACNPSSGTRSRTFVVSKQAADGGDGCPPPESGE